MELSHVLIKFLHIGMSLCWSTHVIKLVEIIGVIGKIGIHVIVAVEAPVVITFVLPEALSGSLTPLRKWIFFYFLKHNSVTNQSYNSNIT
jgi:hypothetical protein